MNYFPKPEIIVLNGVVNETGQLHFFEKSDDFPFEIKRSFWITGVPKGEKRGVHAHKRETQLLIALKGEVEVRLEDRSGNTYSFVLDQPNHALVLPALYWSEVIFGNDAILLVLSDHGFSESDYIRNKEEFDALS
ncbi:sugar 3,4-ketoisomerase [Belliella marina]|uniref:Sugar 3,4-ketoisomerase n=1 Tax=Belliella marina TaxID=1644146 RepID=A0ABW4VU02_9BACT